VAGVAGRSSAAVHGRPSTTTVGSSMSVSLNCTFY
jgi:hypothetical protein